MSTISHQMVMEQIFRELEVLRSGIAQMFLSELSLNNFTNPTVNKTFDNTLAYIDAMIMLEGQGDSHQIDAWIRDSVQSHIAMYVKSRNLMHQLTPQDTAIFNNYLIKAQGVDNALNHVKQFQQAPVVQQGGQRPLVRGGGRPRPTPEADATPARVRLRQRNYDNQAVEEEPIGRVAPCVARGRARGIQPPVAAPVVQTVVDDNQDAEYGVVVEATEVVEVDYNKHQLLKHFVGTGAKIPTTTEKTFETDLRLPPIISMVSDTDEAGEDVITTEVLLKGEGDNDVPPIQMFIPDSFLEDDIKVVQCLEQARAEMVLNRNNAISDGGPAFAQRYKLESFLWCYEDGATAELAIDMNYLNDLVSRTDTPYPRVGISTLHEHLTAVITNAEKAKPTSPIMSLVTEDLEQRATTELNNFLRYIQDTDTRIDSFVDDLPALVEHCTELMGKDAWERLMENPDNDSVGSIIASKLRSYYLRNHPDDPEGEDGLRVLAHAEEIVMVSLSAKLKELGIKCTSPGYNLIPTDDVGILPVLDGILRMCYAIRKEAHDVEIYFTTYDGHILHLREILKADVQGTRQLYWGMKIVK